MSSMVADRPAEESAGQTDKVWVYLFNQLDKLERDKKVSDWDQVRSLLGGKGANLALMTRLDVPVPPGFTVTTEACNAWFSAVISEGLNGGRPGPQTSTGGEARLQ